MDLNDAEIDRIRRACTRWLSWPGGRQPEEMLAELPDTIVGDRYGAGGVVEELEATIADLLGKPASAFFVSGTMAQQVALRIHADRRSTRSVAFHPACHIDQNEGRAFERLHQLIGRPVGDPYSLIGLSDLEEIAEPLAALVLELPQRDLGGRLPLWDELVAQTEWARERGAAVHLDGARIWQCPAAYERSLEEIAGLFDTVYVSFYKDLAGFAGSGLAGPEDFIAEAREWRLRHGGTLFSMWPYAASALAALQTRLPRMKAYRDHALAIAGALRDLDGVRVVPDPPQTSMMHFHLAVSEDELTANVLQIAEKDGIWTWQKGYPGTHPDWQVVELTVGDSTLDFEPGEVRDLIARVVTA
jgi:threonine aldolase